MLDFYMIHVLKKFIFGTFTSITHTKHTAICLQPIFVQRLSMTCRYLEFFKSWFRCDHAKRKTAMLQGVMSFRFSLLFHVIVRHAENSGDAENVWSF